MNLNFKYDTDFVEDGDGNNIYVKTDLQTITLPENIPEIKDHKRFTEKDIQEYYDDLFSCRLSNINGTQFSFCDIETVFCDYCKNEITSETYYYCYDCHYDMCNMCYEETNEEIALKNGAKNYHLRKEYLNKCQQFHEVETRRYICAGLHFCDGCDKITTDNYSNKDRNLEYCLDCVNNDLIEKFDLAKKIYDFSNYSEENNHFGSILNWVPLYGDKDDNLILMNLNEKSKYFKRIVLRSCDNHGRYGYFTIKLSLIETIKKIQDFVESTDLTLENWDAFYNSSIKKLMVEQNCPIHYG